MPRHEKHQKESFLRSHRDTQVGSKEQDFLTVGHCAVENSLLKAGLYEIYEKPL